MSRGPLSPQVEVEDKGHSLPEFLAPRARAPSDSRLVADAVGGMLLVLVFSFWRVTAWYLLVAVGACFLSYGAWAIANRELAELDPAQNRKRRAVRALAVASAAVGFAALAFLMVAVLARIIGQVIS